MGEPKKVGEAVNQTAFSGQKGENSPASPWRALVDFGCAEDSFEKKSATVQLWTQIRSSFIDGWRDSVPPEPATKRNSYGNNSNNNGNWKARKNATRIDEHGRRVLSESGEIYRTQMP
ncbi:hypothetical protein FACS1894125_3990 [Actinomycetota bacterium]|nr:hypothetical protein FACS1894125_3990 [Actinomycetota bacterium]